MIIKVKYILIILRFAEYMIITWDILINLSIYKENKLQE